MKTKRFLFCFLILVVSMQIGCQKEEDPTGLYKELVNGIDHYDSCSAVMESTYGERTIALLQDPISEEDDKTSGFYYDDQALQDAVKNGTQGLVLDNDMAILAYAWDLEPILETFSYISEDCYPVNAERFSNGVLRIVFNSDFHLNHTLVKDGYPALICDFEISVFVSEKDGHIIHISSTTH